ncbi:MAG: hypothetical protein ACYC91_07630 [Solirubrobacteraceae bacterium]
MHEAADDPLHGADARDLVPAVRALIDWYLERLERRGREPVEVLDVPIL